MPHVCMRNHASLCDVTENKLKLLNIISEEKNTKLLGRRINTRVTGAISKAARGVLAVARTHARRQVFL
jgi:hypothetical protein